MHFCTPREVNNVVYMVSSCIEAMEVLHSISDLLEYERFDRHEAASFLLSMFQWTGEAQGLGLLA
jgi:hypothetical protein